MVERASSSHGFWVRVVLDLPLHACFDYAAPRPVPIGTRVIVPLGRRKVVGLVIAQPDQPAIDPEQVRAVDQVLDDLPPMPADWLRMARFAARYYQRPLGEVVLPALPSFLRKVAAYQGKRAGEGPVVRLRTRGMALAAPEAVLEAPRLNVEQAAAIAAVQQHRGHQAVVLHGVTGSGKTEIYLHLAQAALEQGRQVLFLVPEINLTPQLAQAVHGRLRGTQGYARLAVLHSALSETERLRAWLQAFDGQADVLLGTRLAIFAPMPRLGLIIVDEEHDNSYKQQDGLRYSARDLAVWRAHDLGLPVILGSATPSLESWHHANSGRYRRVTLARRARDVSLPRVELIVTRQLRLEHGFAPQLLEALEACLAEGRQALVFLNRRGYAPVLHCRYCGWVSGCTACSARTVLHRSRSGHFLQCHHCGARSPVPRYCPDCGDANLQALGRGTQRLEEFLAQRFPAARIARIDADSTRARGSAARLFAQVHAGEFDLLVGTQMVAKGHDFTRLGLVGVLNADAALFAQDFRAPERLFAQLMQVSGRAGRHEEGGRVLIQTDYPEQAVYRHLLVHDYPGFAREALAERESVGLPPFAWQALLMAEARELAQAMEFLARARDLPVQDAEHYPGLSAVTVYDPVPLRVVRVAHVERAQLLVESHNRSALQAFLGAWGGALETLARRERVRYVLEVDPLEI
ncbi:MAG: primosomal protein N' [Castellaniella sp.]